MKVSVFTPLTQNGHPYIRSTYESLVRQTANRWEWVVLQNGGGLLPEDIAADPRVLVYTANQHTSKGVGALKAQACSLCSGDVLLELDHDDLLHCQALERVAAAVVNGADFVYSDFAEFNNADWSPNVYRVDCGWETYPVTYDGHALLAHKAPEDPAAWRRIEWAPNHLRAWRASFYRSIGGHDEGLVFADDHDLVLRSYLEGGKCVRIPECLYFYRVHETQNVRVRNEEIQSLEASVYNRYVIPLFAKVAQSKPLPFTPEEIEAQPTCQQCGGTGGPPCVDCGGSGKVLLVGRADDKTLRLIDLCGGINTAPGFEPWDLSVGIDLGKHWPAQDGSVGLIRAFDAIEHLHDKIHTMNEAWRVLAPGGLLAIMVPSTDAMVVDHGNGKSELINGSGAYCDPTHVSFWNALSFRYYTQARFSRYCKDIKCRFQASRVQTVNLGGIPYVQAELIALKDGYKPMGFVEI